MSDSNLREFSLRPWGVDNRFKHLEAQRLTTHERADAHLGTSNVRLSK